MRISVVTPVLNEIRFIKGWYENVKKFSDEILVVDTGSTDGTYEFLIEQSQRDRRLFVYRWPETYMPYTWPEDKIRNWMFENVTGNYLCMLDADDMVNDDFIENLNVLSTAKWLIGRFVYLQFWGDYRHLRRRKPWPIIRASKARKSLPVVGLWRPAILRNWLGWYPNKVAKICQRNDRISYTSTGNHCIIQYKNFGRFSLHLPNITKDFNISVHHFHYAHFGKIAGQRNWEQHKKVSLVEYKGRLPDEIKYYQNYEAAECT